MYIRNMLSSTILLGLEQDIDLVAVHISLLVAVGPGLKAVSLTLWILHNLFLRRLNIG